MDHFNYCNDTLYAEEVAIQDIAHSVGTPCYIYSSATIQRHYQVFQQAFGKHPHKICYAVKANSNLAVLNLLASLGAGFDVVSSGELARVIRANGNPKQVVFSGVGKREDEIAFALEKEIYCFNVESSAELERINQIAQSKNTRAPIALRVNPDIDSKGHPYISTGLKEGKFGIPFDEALTLYKQASLMSHINVIGLDYHIGSQLIELGPFIEAVNRMNHLIERLQGMNITLKHLDIGGGLGVIYQKENPPLPDEYAKAILKNCPYKSLTIIVEPGRAISANAGILITKVLYIKKTSSRNFCIVDAAMNDLLRPALYDAWQDIIPVSKSPSKNHQALYDVVGPVCETGDFIGKNRQLNVIADDYLAVRGAGAYGFTMSSNYNSRPRCAEVMVKGDKFQVVRHRETIEQLYQHEQVWDERAQ